MRKLLIAIFLIGFLNITFAQKTGVAIKTLRKVSKYGNRLSDEENKLENFVTEKLVNLKIVKVVERAVMDEFKVEQLLSSGEDFIGGETTDFSKKISADYLMGIFINALDIFKSSSSGSSTTYKCRLSFTIKVFDIATGENILQETFNGNGGSEFLNFTYSADKALDKALKTINESVDGFINKLLSNPNLSLKTSIANVEETDATGAATKVLIALGSSNSIEVGTKFKIVEIIMINVEGKRTPRKKEIGTIEVSVVEDENFSVCKVLTGGIDIAKKKAENKKLQAIIIKP
jgi:hypothetical protein